MKFKFQMTVILVIIIEKAIKPERNSSQHMHAAHIKAILLISQGASTASAFSLTYTAAKRDAILRRH